MYGLDRKLLTKDLLISLLKLNYIKDKICDACQKDKQIKLSFQCKMIFSISRAFDILHIDLIGPFRIRSYGGNFYIFVIVDDYSRFT